jgi:hypothetical protein
MPDPVSATLAVAGSSLVSGAMGASAAKSAARTQAAAADRAAQQQREMFDIGREDLAPYRERGYQALGEIGQRLPYFTQQFTTEEALAPYLDPSMAFRMKYGTQATERLANVGGGALSGNTLRGLTEFGQGLASSEYANAFNRAQTERTNIYNTLANIAGMGQGATNVGVQAGQALGQNLAGLTTGAGAAQAAGQVGAANAISQALQGPTNYLQLATLLGRTPFGPVSRSGTSLASATPTNMTPTQAFAPQAVYESTV